MTRKTIAASPPRAWLALAGVALLAGCMQPPDVARISAPTPIATRSEAPPRAMPGICWGKEAEPPETRTVIEPVLVQPAQITSSGEVISPPIYRREPQQRIVRPGKELWFEVPCPATLTAQYISSLQRALKVRGLHHGPVTGRIDSRTRRAIRRYQAPRGLASGTLSLAAARQLGLAPALLPDTGESRDRG